MLTLTCCAGVIAGAVLPAAAEATLVAATGLDRADPRAQRERRSARRGGQPENAPFLSYLHPLAGAEGIAILRNGLRRAVVHAQRELIPIGPAGAERTFSTTPVPG